jgi:hypothetical protein
VAVLFISDAIELEINCVESSRLRLKRKVSFLREANSVGRDMNPMEADTFRMPDSV